MIQQPETATPPGQVLLRAVDISKSFGHVRALDRANLEVKAGEIHALIGDNGAGKSTLIKIISGVLAPSDGRLEIDGREVQFTDPRAAQEAGIETVYQDLSLAGSLGASDNFFLGRELLRTGLLGRLRVLDRPRMRAIADSHLRELGIALPSVHAPIELLSGGQRQAVAVARATLWGKRLMILDEPTAALGVVQTKLVLDLLLRTRDSGVAILLISHDLAEILQVADQISVMRLGHRVLTAKARDVSTDRLIAALSGLSPEENGPR